MDDVTLPVNLVVEVVRQTGGVAVAVLAFLGVLIGFVGRAMWDRRRSAPQTQTQSAEQAEGLHTHIAGILEEQRKLYEGIISEQRRLHAERTQRIAELTAELHEVREELRHLYRVLQEHGIQAPPRGVAP